MGFSYGQTILVRGFPAWSLLDCAFDRCYRRDGKALPPCHLASGDTSLSLLIRALKHIIQAELANTRVLGTSL